MSNGIRRSISMIALGLLVAITVAACGTEEEKVEPTVTRIPDAANAPATYTPTVEGEAPPTEVAAASPTGDAGGGGTGGGGEATTVEIDMQDISFKETTIEIPANTDVTIHLVNSGALQHQFAIEGQDVKSDVLNSGETQDLTINLPAGNYTYHCPIPGHTEAGMKGTLTVK